ncbi:MAG TPA: DUF1800 domain-containing protein [Acidimicrobiia bacterium]|jgi:uncharacterized protein (DUF1800 family)
MAQLPVITMPTGAPAAPTTAAPEPERRRVARLLHRAGFGDKVEVIDQWAAKGYVATVDHLLSFPPASTRPDETVRVAQEGSAPANELDGYDITPLARMWLSRMAATQHPLEEKLTLYWHNHLATAFSKVRRPRLMVAQNRLLRDHAGGNFRALAKAITADAAMLYWLDGNTNQLAAPNENYGREFMELFTLGKDRYTQEDVRQAARAFTGYTVDNQGTVTFHPELHDQGEKVILGHRGNFGPLDVADVVLDDHPDGPVGARYVAQRLAGFLYRPDPEPEVVEAMAGAFAGSGYEIKPMVRVLLLRPEFSDGPGVTIKSPAEFVAGAMRALGLVATPTLQAKFRELDELAAFCAAMGQELYNPPTWPAGRAEPPGPTPPPPCPGTTSRPGWPGSSPTTRWAPCWPPPAASPGRPPARGWTASASSSWSPPPIRPWPATSTSPPPQGPTHPPGPGACSPSCWPPPTTT